MENYQFEQQFQLLLKKMLICQHWLCQEGQSAYHIIRAYTY
jgi:hypothetical protein